MYEDVPHWEYEGERGSDRWGELSRSYALCKLGQKQSPIDISEVAPANLPPLTFDYQLTTPSIINNGHTVQVNYPPTSTLRVGDDEYQLVQFHFHSPSEHTVNGQHHAMELHLVHHHANDALAVVGVFLTLGETNPTLEPLWERLPSYAGEERPLSINLDPADLLPRDRRTYRYEGSLTTPPCSEGVRWLVMRQPIGVSQGQVDKFRTIFPANSRPTQPLNERRVVTEG